MHIYKKFWYLDELNTVSACMKQIQNTRTKANKSRLDNTCNRNLITTTQAFATRTSTVSSATSLIKHLPPTFSPFSNENSRHPTRLNRPSLVPFKRKFTHHTFPSGDFKNIWLVDVKLFFRQNDIWILW